MDAEANLRVLDGLDVFMQRFRKHPSHILPHPSQAAFGFSLVLSVRIYLDLSIHVRLQTLTSNQRLSSTVFSSNKCVRTAATRGNGISMAAPIPP